MKDTLPTFSLSGLVFAISFVEVLDAFLKIGQLFIVLFTVGVLYWNYRKKRAEALTAEIKEHKAESKP